MLSEKKISDLNNLQRTRSTENRVDGSHYIVLKHLYTWMETVAPQYVRGRLLDYGCGGQTYRSLFEDKCDTYIGADVAAAAGIELDLKIVPNVPLDLDPGSIDCVLSNQVLEHVPDPGFYLGEASRVLKDDGTLILTAPMQWRHHEMPFDYYRYTKFGLEELLDRNGMEIVSIDSLGGAYSLMGQIFCGAYAARTKTYNSFVIKMANKLFLRLDRAFPDEDDTLGWVCIARKKTANSD